MPFLQVSMIYFQIAGLTGCAILILVCLLAALAYAGKRGERYSPLNHFISELGEIGISRRAKLFNLGLIAGGLLLIPYIVALGLLIENIWAKLGMAAGVWAAISCLLVGLHPMDNMEPHMKAAMSFFDGGLLTSIFFTVALWTQKIERVTKTAAILGLLAFAAYAAFLITLTVLVRRAKGGLPQEFQLQEEQVRPRLWAAPILEWLVLLMTLIWFVAMALGVR